MPIGLFSRQKQYMDKYFFQLKPVVFMQVVTTGRAIATLASKSEMCSLSCALIHSRTEYKEERIENAGCASVLRS